MLLGQLLLFLAILLLLVVPRKYAPVIFLGAMVFIPQGSGVMLGSLNFTPARTLVVIGWCRCFLRAERPASFPMPVDKFLFLFAAIAIGTSFLHADVGSTIVFRVAYSIDVLGTYFLIRSWVWTWDDVSRVMRAMLAFCVLLATTMMIEFFTRRNLFNYIGGIPADSAMRDGRVRARGPFRHSILAGTFGCIAFPFAIALWKSNRRIALVGGVGAVSAVVASTSGGPFVTMAAVTFALVFWRYRARLRTLIWGCVAGLCLLQLVMKAPVWYLMARLPLSGGGYFRARLIDSAVKYLNEWWLAGTDVTRHWMPSGVPWSQTATDIVNEYLAVGVMGGLPLMLTFIAIVIYSFKQLSRAYWRVPDYDTRGRFVVWCVGSSLFGHVVSMFSIDYYDQSKALLYALLSLLTSFAASFTGLEQKRIVSESESVDSSFEPTFSGPAATSTMYWDARL